jgi:uridine kinase
LDNKIAIDLVASQTFRQLQKRGIMFLRNELAMTDDVPTGTSLPDSFILMKSTNQIRGIHTIIRDRETKRHDFIFYSDRLSRLLIERALNELPFKPTEITTPTESNYKGYIQESSIAAVTIVRAGSVMEKVPMCINRLGAKIRC